MENRTCMRPVHGRAKVAKLIKHFTTTMCVYMCVWLHSITARPDPYNIRLCAVWILRKSYCTHARITSKKTWVYNKIKKKYYCSILCDICIARRNLYFSGRSKPLKFVTYNIAIGVILTLIFHHDIFIADGGKNIDIIYDVSVRDWNAPWNRWIRKYIFFFKIKKQINKLEPRRLMARVTSKSQKKRVTYILKKKVL